MNKYLLITINVFLFNCGFAQIGKYEWTNIPKEHLYVMKDSAGNNLIPSLRIGTITIKIKPFKKAIVEYNKERRDEQIFKGKWIIENGLLLIKAKNSAETKEYKFEIVQLKSGVYLKSSNGYNYFKKE
ncbi:hypothetical protein K6119_09415 [Paracrocinitomix mangrovi]|uniref:hypothetical protein n=1 Tax=Paracrocinitomix mangrovi TaxID=2862509 RepID=UPI001C8E8B1F|nr:hypothetical protein [Paracrocinitomix mangrovi]UKN03708.1 hypothetical protein K6119_09415 [Paracrocinitomix mangrovi]